MKGIRTLFLLQVYKADKWLFIVLVAFIFLQAFFTFKGVETLPFFNYGMYSERQFQKEYYHFTMLSFNDEQKGMDELKNLPAAYLSSILSYYTMLKEAGFKDPVDVVVQHRFKAFAGVLSDQIIIERLENTASDEALFYEWLCQYINSFSNESVREICISDYTYKWQHGKFILTDDSVIHNYSCNPRLPEINEAR